MLEGAGDMLHDVNDVACFFSASFPMFWPGAGTPLKSEIFRAETGHVL